MATNKLYDIIIVGASEEGLNICTQLVEKNPAVQIAFISKHFKLQAAKHNLTNVDKFTQEVVFSCHKARLLGVYMADKSAVFGKIIIIATGTKPVKSPLKSTAIYYNLIDIKPNKNGVAVIYGEDDRAAASALVLAKKFKYVYLCTNSLDLTCASKYQKKIENTANIVHLPNCNIVACKNDKNGGLSEVLLDTYSAVKCSTIVMSLGRSPDLPGFDKRMLKVDADGYIITKEFSETTVVPNIFAIGGCTKSAGSQRLATVATTILDRVMR